MRGPAKWIPMCRSIDSARTKLTFVCALLALISPVGHADDLLSIYALSRANDPLFQAAEFTLRAEQQLPRQARAALLPNVNASAARIRARDEISGSAAFLTEGSATFNVNQYGIDLTQTIFDRGKSLSLAQAQSQSRVAELEFQSATQQLILRVAIRYFAVLAAQDDVDLSIAEKRAVARQLELADERLQVGLGTKTDLFDAQARFRLAEAQEIRARNFLDNARQALGELIGQPPPALTKLGSGSPVEGPSPEDVQAWVDRALSDNLDLEIARQTETVAEQELERQRAGRYPSLDLVVRHNVSDADGSISGPGIKNTSTDALVQLSVPIYQGGSVDAQTREALYRLQAAQKQTESALRSADRTTRSAYSDIITSIRQAEALDQAVVASESALEAKREGFAAGLDTNIDVLNAQRDLFRAKRDYLQSRYEYILNFLRLQQAVGELDEDDLEKVNGWLG